MSSKAASTTAPSAAAKTGAIPKNGTGAKTSAKQSLGDDYIPCPDKTKFFAEMDALRAKLTEQRASLTKQKAVIDKQKADGPQSPEEQTLREQHTAVLVELKALRDTERKILADAQKIDESVKQKVSELQVLRPKSGPRTIKEVDARIEALERQVESGSLRIVEESMALKEVAGLKKLRTSFDHADSLQKEVDAVRLKSAELRKQIDMAALRAVMQRKQDLEEQLDAFKAQRQRQKTDMDSLFGELRTIQAEMKKTTAAMDAKRADYDSRMNEFQAKLMARKNQREIEEKNAVAEAAHMKHVTVARAKLAEAKRPAFSENIKRAQELLAKFDPTTANAVDEPETVTVAKPTSTNLNRKKQVKVIPGAGTAATTAATQAALLVAGSAADSSAATSVSAVSAGAQHPPSRKSLKLQRAQQKAQQLVSEGEPQGVLGAGGKPQLDFATIEALSALNIAIPSTSEEVEVTKTKLREKIAFYKENNARVTQERTQRAEAELNEALSKTPMAAPADAAAADAAPSADDVPATE